MGDPVQLLPADCDLPPGFEPAPCRREGAILRTDHCAECCSDPGCPRCWAEGATIELELVPLPRA